MCKHGKNMENIIHDNVKQTTKRDI